MTQSHSKSAAMGASAKNSPSWVSPALVAYTIATWQPFYRNQLTESDAIEILVNVGRLIDGTREDSR